MKKQLWGNIADDNKAPAINVVPPIAKKAKLNAIDKKPFKQTESRVCVKVKNPLVTQTIEVMKQTEMLQSLIDTYSNKSGSNNYLLNPCQMIPQVDFPPENATEFHTDEKFTKPIWFIPPIESGFSRGSPIHYPRINVEVCKASIRKSICGQLRIAGFTDTTDSALVLFIDTLEEFIKNFVEQIKDVQSNEYKDTLSTVDITSLEKAYYTLTSTSLTGIHNYFKHNLIARNRSEIAEFNGVFQEYNKLMKDSQNMQKSEFSEGDFINILEMSNHGESTMPTHQQKVESERNNATLTIIKGQGHITVQNNKTFQPGKVMEVDSSTRDENDRLV